MENNTQDAIQMHNKLLINQ